MISPVRDKTRSVINRAKRSGLGSSRPLGVVVNRRVRDIASDTLVNKRAYGLKWGENKPLDLTMLVFGTYALAQLAARSRVNKKEELYSDIASVAIVAGTILYLTPATLTI